MQEHQHKWGRSHFVAGLEVRYCEKDCPAAQAKNSGDRWERIDKSASGSERG